MAGYYIWTKIEEIATVALPGESNPALDYSIRQLTKM